MPVNLFPAPYSRIQQAPIIISPTPASHALPHLGGSLGMGMAHPHPAMSTAMMPDAAVLGLSMHMPSQSVRVPGAVLTNGVANPYMQHNSLASAGPAYPYNASIYSDLPDQREQQQTHYMRSIPRSQEFGRFDSGIYAYAGGMPDTRTAGNPRPSVYQNYGYPAVGITGGHVMAPTATGYASTIYPDSPTIDTRDSGTRRVKDCSACRAQRLQEQINLVDEIACDCHDSRNRHRRSREPRIRNTKPSFTDSSSDADAEDMSYFSSSGEQRRRRGDSEPRQLAESDIPQRSRQHTSQSGTRNASRAPRLPSLAQLSFDNQRPRTSEPLLEQLRRSGVAQPDRLPEDSGAKILHYRSHKSSPSRHGCLEDEFHLLQPDDLRMSNLHLRDLGGVHEKSHRREARSPIVVKAARPPSTMAMVNESPYLEVQSPRAFHIVPRDRSRSKEASRDRGDVHRVMHSQGRAPSSWQRYPQDRSEEALPQQHMYTQRGDDLGEVYPLSSRRHSPSRMHQHQYIGNQPATITTHSKLHPFTHDA